MIHFINPLYAKESLRLASMCLAHNVPFEIAEMCHGLILFYPCREECVSDAICHDGSYGRHDGLLEIMGLVNEEEVGDSVEGYLTAEQIFERWQKHWLENHSKEDT